MFSLRTFIQTFTCYFVGTTLLAHSVFVSATERPLQEALKAQVPLSVWQQIEEDQYRIRTNEKGHAFSSPNHEQAYQTVFTAKGPRVLLKAEGTPLSIQLVALAQGGQQITPAVKRIYKDVAQANKLVYQREDGVSEWYVNRANGIEQGFTIEEAINKNSDAPLQLTLEVNAAWHLTLTENALQLDSGKQQLSYAGLKAWDADGKILTSRFKHISSQRIALLVDTVGVRYPLTVDPVIQNENRRLEPYKAAEFGQTIAIDEDVMVVGAFRGGNNVARGGMSYIFERHEGGTDNWGRVKKLAPGNGHFTFGSSVDIDGDTVVVGTLSGNSAYVFKRNQGGTNNWGEVKKLIASDETETARFGRVVAISNNNIVVGTSLNGDNGVNSGSAYIFSRSQGGADNWGEVKKLKSSDGGAFDGFGASVAISGNNLVIGANDSGRNGNGSAYIFSLHTGGVNNWGEVKKLTASDGADADRFGSSVAISGNNAVVGAKFNDSNGIDSGSAYVFGRTYGGTGNWGEVKKLISSDGEEGDNFGYSVAIRSDAVVVGAAFSDSSNGVDSGSAYVFKHTQGGINNWGEVKKLIASDGTPSDRFGYSVAIGGVSIVIGTPRGDSGDGFGSGLAYTFNQDLGGVNNWGEQKKLAAMSLESHLFGSSIAINGYTIVVGVSLDDDVGRNAGAVYVFAGSGDWATLTKKLIGSDTRRGDQFGKSVSISDNHIVVGATGDDDNDLNSGSVYVFERDLGGTNNWGEVKKLLASDGARSDLFGDTISISENNMVIGTRYDNFHTGAAYVFNRNWGGLDNWGEVKKLTASDGTQTEEFATSLSISGNHVIVGAPRDSDNGNVSGSAYVFSRNHGGTNNWGEVKKLTARDAAGSDAFGTSVAMSENNAVVGAYGDDDAGSLSGSAYVFNRNLNGENSWSEVIKLTASDGAENDKFGRSVAISGNTVVVGADGDSGAGAAYIFNRINGGMNHWGEVKKLTASDAAVNNEFGRAVAISGTDVVVGAPGHSSGGVVYFFQQPMGIISVALLGSTADFIESDQQSEVNSATLILQFNAYGTGFSDPLNYMLYTAGADGVMQSNLANGCEFGPQGDDVIISIDAVDYNSVYDSSSTSILTVNGGIPLPDNKYSLLVCSSIQAIYGAPLDGNGDGVGGDDYVLDFTVKKYQELCFPVLTKNESVVMICL